MKVLSMFDGISGAHGGGWGAKTRLYEIENKIRKLTPVECERLQTFPNNYTEGVSNTQRYKTLGNAFTVDVIVHILKYLKGKESTMKPTEHQEQKTVVDYCKIKRIPIVAIPNSQKMSAIDRDIAWRVTEKLKAEGMAKGFPDLFIPVVNDKGGLFIEMKSLSGTVSPDQKDWISQLNNTGYKAVICHSSIDAIKVIEEYVR